MSYRIFILSTLLAACSSATPQPDAPARSSAESTDSSSASTAAATQPDADKLTRHLSEHVTYPASRDDILAACASTPEFTEGEKRWAADHLPEGQYENADEATSALGI